MQDWRQCAVCEEGALWGGARQHRATLQPLPRPHRDRQSRGLEGRRTGQEGQWERSQGQLRVKVTKYFNMSPWSGIGVLSINLQMENKLLYVSVVYCAQINLQRNVAAACLMFNK